jgi:hypothetical protein
MGRPDAWIRILKDHFIDILKIKQKLMILKNENVKLTNANGAS